MRYLVNETYYDDIDEVINACIEDDYHEDDEYFEEWLNDEYGYITIAGQTFYAYDILNSMNDYLFDEERDEFCERMNDDDREDAQYELSHAKPGTTVYIHHSEVLCLEDEEEDDDDANYNREESLEAVRTFVEEQKLLADMKAAEEKVEEDDIMKMFQVI